MSLMELFCAIDDFWQIYEPVSQATLLENGQQRLRECQLSMSKMMSIIVYFHQKRYVISKPITPST